MCGIVGAVADRDIVPILIEGLRRLEYRGYDSAGVAVLNGTGHIKRLRTVGKVRKLQDALDADPTHGGLGIAHTRWATHGVPSERNAHPHISKDGIAIVHNGIIENHEELRAEAKREGYEFTSETDTEVIAHRIHHHLKVTGDLFKAVRATVAELEGAYALAVVSQDDPDRIVVARQGCPVVIGLGEDENFVASDVAALLPVTRNFIFLEEGDVAEIRRNSVRILDRDGNTVAAPGQAERAVGRRRREGRVRALHAQGNPRAAARGGADARGARRRRQAARGRVRPGRPGRVREDRGRAHRRLRHELPRRHGRQVLHRADLPAALLGGDRERVPLPQPGGAEEHAVREHLAVRRDGRHARRAQASPSRAGTSRSSRSATCPRARWCANRSS